MTKTELEIFEQKLITEGYKKIHGGPNAVKFKDETYYWYKPFNQILTKSGEERWEYQIFWYIYDFRPYKTNPTIILEDFGVSSEISYSPEIDIHTRIEPDRDIQETIEKTEEFGIYITTCLKKYDK